MNEDFTESNYGPNRNELFETSYPMDSTEGKLRTIEELEADDGTGPGPINTWPEWAAHLLKVESLEEVSLVQDEDPHPTLPDKWCHDIVGAPWNDFQEVEDLTDTKDIGYARLALGTINGIEAVQFFDTGYSAWLFRTKDVAQFQKPGRIKQVNERVAQMMDGLKKLGESLTKE